MERSAFDETLANIARILVGGVFVILGINNLLDPLISTTRLDIQGAGLIMVCIALLKILCGIAIAIRYHTRYAAGALLLYTMLVSLIFYGPHLWIDRALYEFVFLRNTALVGGLLFIYAHSRDYTHWREDTWMGKSQKEIVTNGGKSPSFNEGPPH